MFECGTRVRTPRRCGAGASYATAGVACRAGIVLIPCRPDMAVTLIIDNIHLTIPHGKMTVLASQRFG